MLPAAALSGKADATQPAQPSARIDQVDGTATLLRADGVITGARPGMAVGPGDILQTGDATLGLAFADGSRLALGHDSRVLLKAIAADGSTGALALDIVAIQGSLVLAAAPGDARGVDTVITLAGDLAVRQGAVLLRCLDRQGVEFLLLPNADGSVGQLTFDGGAAPATVEVAYRLVTVDASGATPALRLGDIDCALLAGRYPDLAAEIPATCGKASSADVRQGLEVSAGGDDAALPGDTSIVSQSPATFDLAPGAAPLSEPQPVTAVDGIGAAAPTDHRSEEVIFANQPAPSSSVSLPEPLILRDFDPSRRWEGLGRVDEFAGQIPELPLQSTRLITARQGDMASLDATDASPRQIEEFLRLGDGTLSTVFGAGQPDGGSAIRALEGIRLQTGQSLRFDVFFDAATSLPFNDFAVLTVATAGKSLAVQVGSVADAGDLGASGWQTVEYTAGTDGTYTFGFAMLNAAGSRGISRLFVDNIRLQETAAFEFRTLDVVTDSLGGSIRRLAAAPLANADAFSVPANETLTRPGAAGLLANDVDPDPFDALSIAGIDRTGAVGRASVDSGNTLVYDPRGRFDALAAGETATDGFAYLVDGGNGITQRGQVSVTVTGVNDAPLARPDAAAASEDDPAVNIGVTRNDSDIDSDDSAATLRVIAASAASGADIEFSGLPGDGIIYRPSAVARFQLLDDGETATDLITYTIADRHGAEATATVTVTVFGRDEGGVDEFARTGEDSALALSAGDILANTFGADAAAKLTITGIDAAQATAAVGFDGRTLTYDPTGRFDALGTGESRGETIGFTATDAGGNAVTASLKVTVLGLNDAPAALDDAAATAENARVSIDVTANDRDADAGDALDVIAIDTTGTRGTVALAADGTLTYDPAGRFDALVEGETATDSFRYTVADGQGGESSAEVAVRVLGRNDLERLASSFEQPLTFDERTTTFVRTVGDYRETDGDGASFLPTDGALMARIEARGSSTGVIESFLGLAAGSLPRDIDGSFPAIGAAVRVPVAVEAGDRVSFDWMFDARDFTRNPPDGLADNDLALFTVDDGSGGADLFRLTDVRQVGDQGASGWRTSVYTAPASGTLIIGFASVNDRTVETSGPEAENSFLLVDNVRVNRAFGDGYQVVDSQGDGAFETVAHAQAVA